MQSVGSKMVTMNSGFARSVDCGTIALLSLATALTLNSPPALASEMSDSGPADRAGLAAGRATAVASARVIQPFAMTATAKAATGRQDDGITVSRRTTTRDCSLLYGVDAAPRPGTSCELRLIELQ